MATTITCRLLHHLALFLLVVQVADAVLSSKTRNHAAAALKPQTTSTTTYIVHANDLAKPPHFRSLEDWYRSMVTTHAPSTRAASSGGIMYTYDTVMNGFAVQLTADEARRMSSAPGVIGVYNDRVFYPQTTRSPGFMGLDPRFGSWHDTDFGDGIIIGFVDTGIWPESLSFNDNGLGPVRPSWRGMCVDAGDFNASLCNNKLVGAKVFAGGDEAMRRSKANSSLPLPSPRDDLGHGTHVASTAAGCEVHGIGIGIHIFRRDTAIGVAPKARIAMYRVTTGSGSSDIVAAIDAAVNDGVDVLSISMAMGACVVDPCPFYNDSFAIATFGAARAGVFVVLSAGNGGPQASTVVNAAPWVTTVGAATVDRLFTASLRLGDGTTVTGQSLYDVKANGTNMVPLVFNECSETSLNPDSVMGKIVVCKDSDEEDGNANAARDEDEGLGVIVQRAGAAGLVLVDPDEECSSSQSLIPSLVLSEAEALKLKSYMSSAQFPTAAFDFAGEAAIGDIRAPMVPAFSSRGPNPVAPELLKPDIIAPGHNIVAAWLGRYEVASGTSMSSPHVAGVAALIKKKHASWTPAMVRSALMTTAATLDNEDRQILDKVIDSNGNAKVATPFATGAGHVRPQLAMDPGLAYDAGERDYVDFLCALNYTVDQMRPFVPDFVNCTGTLAGLNYPSFVVVFDKHTNVRALTRTVTKVSEEAEMYNVTVAAPLHVKVTVTPTTLEFKEHMERKSYSVEFRSEAGGHREAGEWDFGQIVWANAKHQVRSPVAFLWN